MKTFKVSILIEAKNKEQAEVEYFDVISGCQPLDVEIEDVK